MGVRTGLRALLGKCVHSRVCVCRVMQHDIMRA